MPNNIEILILSGGEGRRLRSVISDVPKPMAPIGNKPFLDYLIKSIASQGFTNFCFLTGYKSEIISSYVQDNFKELNVRFSVEESPLGTGGAILEAIRSSSHDKFLILNGDTFFNIDLNKFLSNWKPGTLKMALKKIADSARYGRVEIDGDSRVVSFIEKGSESSAAENLINGGIYIMDKSFLSYQKKDQGFISLENEIFPLLLEKKKIFAQAFDDDFIDIGIPEDYIRAQILIESWLK